MTKIAVPAELVARWPNIRLDQIEPDMLSHMTDDTLDLFNAMVRNAERRNGWMHRINSTWREGATGQHPLGRAIDFVFFRETPGDIDVIEQFRFARDYPWGGIGMYPYWHAPGLHVDTRQGCDHVATWYRDKAGNYKSITQYERAFDIVRREA